MLTVSTLGTELPFGYIVSAKSGDDSLQYLRQLLKERVNELQLLEDTQSQSENYRSLYRSLEQAIAQLTVLIARTEQAKKGMALRRLDAFVPELWRAIGTVKMCKSCGNSNQSEFSSEICIHFPGLQGLDIPAVFVFPKLVVCLDCGFTECLIPETELRRLAVGASHAA